MLNVNYGKFGQMKIQQTAFMLIAITLLFIFAGIFVLSISFSNLKDAREQIDEENALSLTLSLSSYPEFSCGESFGRDRSFCIDGDKFMAIKKVSEKEYSDFWKISGIEIRKMYNESEILCTDMNYPNCGILRLFSDSYVGSDKSAFVTLCHKEKFEGTFYDKCELAKIIVRFEDVE